MAIAVMITTLLSFVCGQASTDEITTFEAFSLPQNVVLDAEQATDNANHAVTSNPSSRHALSRLQSLSWRSDNPYHRVLQPDKAVDYGIQAAQAAEEQFEHTLVVTVSTSVPDSFSMNKLNYYFSCAWPKAYIEVVP